MLGSLFGELGPRRLPAQRDADGDFPATAILEGGPASPASATATASNAVDVVVDASPARAMRTHFAQARADLAHASAMITLMDPSRLWASQVVRALSDAVGQPLERLNLRERATLRTLAVIERTLVPRRDGRALRVYHADIRAAGLEHDEIANALAEGSHLTAVVIGALQPLAAMALLRSLLGATREPEWRCPWLVFLVPPGAPALRNRILQADWPPHIQVAALTESLVGASSVWNTVLGAWEATERETTPTRTDAESIRSATDRPAKVSHPVARSPAPTLSTHPEPAPTAYETRCLGQLMACDGVLAGGIVDLRRGDLLASDCRQATSDDLERVAHGLAAARRAHTVVCGQGALAADELLVAVGARQHLLRCPGDQPTRGIVAVLDRGRCNLALIRFKLMEIERVV